MRYRFSASPIVARGVLYHCLISSSSKSCRAGRRSCRRTGRSRRSHSAFPRHCHSSLLRSLRASSLGGSRLHSAAGVGISGSSLCGVVASQSRAASSFILRACYDQIGRERHRASLHLFRSTVSGFVSQHDKVLAISLRQCSG